MPSLATANSSRLNGSSESARGYHRSFRVLFPRQETGHIPWGRPEIQVEIGQPHPVELQPYVHRGIREREEMHLKTINGSVANDHTPLLDRYIRNYSKSIGVDIRIRGKGAPTKQVNASGSSRF